MIRTPSRPALGASLLVALLIGCQDGATAPKTLPSSFPTAEGSTWRYAYADPRYGEGFRWTVTRKTGDTVVLDRPSPGTHPGPVTLVVRNDGLDIRSDRVGTAALYRFTPGAEWTRHEPWECDDGSRWIVVPEPDPILTPVGHFTGTLRLERRSTATCADAGTMREWWAPGTGIVMWEELNFFAGAPVTVWLVDHDQP